MKATLESSYSATFGNDQGQAIKKLLLKNLPSNPNRRNDFLIACHMHTYLLRKKHFTAEGRAYLVVLSYMGASQLNEGSTVIKKRDIGDWWQVIGATEYEQKKAIRRLFWFQRLYLIPNLSEWQKQLPKTIFSNQYLIGAHCGDGSLNIVYDWTIDPVTKEVKRRNFIAQWSISDPCEPYLEAMKFTMGGGQIKSTGPNSSSKQFVFKGIKACVEKIIALFKPFWLPLFKRRQFQAFQKACALLISNRVQTEQEVNDFIDLTYKMSNKDRRAYSIQQYKEWGLLHLQSKQAKNSRVLKIKPEMYDSVMDG